MATTNTNTELIDSDALDKAFSDAIEARNPGICFFAPEWVQPATTQLPVTGFVVQTLRQASLRPSFEDMALLVVSESNTDRVSVARAFADPTDAVDDPPPPPDPGEGFTGTTFALNAVERAGLNLRSGMLTLWMLARDQVSLPKNIRVADPPKPRPAVQDPEVLKFVAEWRLKNPLVTPSASAASVWPTETIFGSYPSYGITAESPALPARGIALWAKRVLMIEKGLRWVVAGSFRLPVQPRHIVSKPVSGDATTAVVPITLVLTSSEFAGPAVLRLRVPCRSPVARDGAISMAEGRFTIDLLTLPGVWRGARTCYVYGVFGDTLSAPAITTFVTEAMMESLAADPSASE